MRSLSVSVSRVSIFRTSMASAALFTRLLATTAWPCSRNIFTLERRSILLLTPHTSSTMNTSVRRHSGRSSRPAPSRLRVVHADLAECNMVQDGDQVVLVDLVARRCSGSFNPGKQQDLLCVESVFAVGRWLVACCGALNCNGGDPPSCSCCICTQIYRYSVIAYVPVLIFQLHLLLSIRAAPKHYTMVKQTTVYIEICRLTETNASHSS